MRWWIAVVVVSVGCSNDETTSTPTGPSALFPESYPSGYTEVRDCRQSGEHDLNLIRVLADPAALSAYTDRTERFPEGAVVLKEEYDFGDITCSGPIKQWTVMVKLADGAAPDALDWKWQRVLPDRTVAAEDEPRCYGCHSGCTPDMGGYDFTCTVP